jgi:two-component system NarL family response regulator
LITLLSKREQVALSLVAQGLTNKEIATTLVISENTVKVHLRNIMEKLHAHTRQQAVSMVGGKDLLPRFTQTDTEQV